MQFSKEAVFRSMYRAVLYGTDTTSTSQGAGERQEAASKPHRVEEATARPTEPPEARIISPLERYATAQAVALGLSLSRGAIRLWELLHAVAVRYAARKGYSRATSFVTFAAPQRLIAVALGYTVRHVYRLQAELEAAGLLDSHALADEVDGRHMWATTLWAVKLTTSATAPRLTPDDFRHEWRDFAADLKRKNTVQAVMSTLKTLEESKRVLVVLHSVVTGVFSLNTRYPSFRADILPNAVQDAVYRLGSLADSPGAATVAELAAAISTGLADGHSFRFWCRRLWAVVGSWEKVGHLQAQLQRIVTDLAEYPDIRKPGAWAVARVGA